MAVFYSLLIALTIALTALITNTFESFKNYGIKSQEYSDYQTTALASATRVAKESGKFLTELKTHVSCVDSSDQTDEDCSEDKTPAQSLEDLITNLEDHSENQLNKTILFGLKNKQDYKIELLHSEYIPAQFTEEDKKYISTLLKTKAGSQTSVDADELKGFSHEDKLKISGKLLEKIFTPEKLEQVKNNQADYGLVVSDEGLDYCDLPNGLKLKLNKNEILRSKDDDNKNYMTQLAVAQIRLGEVEESITPIVVTDPEPPKTNPPNPVPPVNNPPPLDPATRLELALSVMPLSQRGFLFDANQAIDKNNPLQIINKREGGYSSVFVQDDGFLRVSIGSITTSLSSNKLLPAFENAELSFDTVTLSFTENQNNPGMILSAADSSNLNIVENKRIEIDIVPRGRTTYTVADNSFVINGITIPKSSVIVASRETGNFERSAELNDFESFRVYDPTTGNFITNFGNNALSRMVCSAGANSNCVNVKKFLQPPATTQLGQDILYSFSLKDLMPGVPALTATENWAKIQTELELAIQSNLSAPKTDWLSDELKKLNKQELLYTGVPEIDDLTEEDLERLSGLLESGNTRAFRESLHLTSTPPDLDPNFFNSYERSLLTAKWAERTEALYAYATAKVKLWDSKKSQSKEEVNTRIDTLQSTKDLYSKALNSYNADRKLYSSIDLLDPAQVTAQKKLELEAQIQNLKTQISDLESRKKLVKNAINDTEARIKALRQAINDLKGIKSKKAEREKKEANLAAKQIELAKYNDALNAIKFAIAQKEAELNSVKTQLSRL